MDFQTAERQYQVLRKALEAGRISPEEYRALVKRIVVYDEQNRRWQLGPASGEWHRLDGKQWVKDTPPAPAEERPGEPQPPAAQAEPPAAASVEQTSPGQQPAVMDFPAPPAAPAASQPAAAAPPKKARKPAPQPKKKSFVARYWPLLALGLILLGGLVLAGLYVLSQYLLPETGLAGLVQPASQATVTPAAPTPAAAESWLPGTWKRSGEDAAYDIFYQFAPDGRFVKTSPSLRETQGFGVYRVLEGRELLLLFSGAAAESIPFQFDGENNLLLYGVRFTRSDESVGAPLATPSAPGSLPVSTQGLPLMDDFSNIYSGWSQETSPFASYGYEEGKYSIAILEKDLLFFPVLRDNSLNAGDVVLEVKAENASGEETTAAGLICRLNHPGTSFYTFEVSWDGGVFIGKYIDGVWTELARQSDHPAVQRGDLPNRLKAVCLGQTLELYVNGTLALQARDSSLPSGAPAFYARTAPDQLSGVVLFDDFLAYQP